MNTLTSITLKASVFPSKKLVGIISHREELMENIPQQIKVKKTKDGSQITIKEWIPAFGQLGSAQGKLRNAGVEAGDLILFFGWFRKTIMTESGYRFASKVKKDFYAGNDLQAIFGYMQIGEILTDQEKIKKYYWHPHSTEIHTSSKNNVLYLPSEKLSLIPTLKGFGTLSFRNDRVLTKQGCTRATWNAFPFLMPEHVKANVKNSAKSEGLYYAGIWQEIVFEESPGLIEWVKRIVAEKI